MVKDFSVDYLLPTEKQIYELLKQKRHDGNVSDENLAVELFLLAKMGVKRVESVRR